MTICPHCGKSTVTFGQTPAAPPPPPSNKPLPPPVRTQAAAAPAIPRAQAQPNTAAAPAPRASAKCPQCGKPLGAGGQCGCGAGRKGKGKSPLLARAAFLLVAVCVGAGVWNALSGKPEPVSEGAAPRAERREEAGPEAGPRAGPAQPVPQPPAPPAARVATPITPPAAAAPEAPAQPRPNVPPAPPAPATPTAMAEATGSATLKVGEVVIQKPKGTGGKSLVYAVGTVTNLAQAQRFGVKVVLSLHKRDGEKVGENTSDIKSMLEPGETWKFFAPVHEPTAVTAKLVKIEEDRN